jgi:hypothetical protein
MTRTVTCKDSAGAAVADSLCSTAPPPRTQVCSGPACTVYVVGEPTADNGPCYRGVCMGLNPAFPPCPAGYVDVRSELACGNPNECGGSWALCTFQQVTGYGCRDSGYFMPVAVRQCNHQ